MNRDIWIKQSRAISEGMDSLRWYQRTRPGAERLLLAPAFCVFVTLVFAVVWGELHLVVLALVLVGTFAVLAGQLTGELRERELETRSSRAVRPEVAPLLARIAESRSEDKPEPTAFEQYPPSALGGLTDAEPTQPVAALGSTEDVSVGARLDVEPESEPIALSSHEPIEVDEPQSPRAPDVDVTPRADSEPVHEVREPGAGPVLHTCSTFLDACDFAFEFIEEDDPAELEIVRVAGDTRNVVWSYARTDAIANRESVDDTERFLAMIARQSWRRGDVRSTRLRGARRRRA